ncbi:MAG: UDP-2,4-diacetamido-2,4,6-trideoxy-beta-L-altropyranose hydrolase [Pseudomonadota bacterium]
MSEAPIPSRLQGQVVAFRAEASLEIGNGHVMRCLTLADMLATLGVHCHFICREHSGHLLDLICRNGHIAHSLPAHPEHARTSSLANKSSIGRAPAHAHWLGVTQSEDVADCASILAEIKPDWLIVDHYALDARWELALKPHYRRLMVIDDLADRPHECELILDQTFGRQAEDYRAWVPTGCQLMCGSRYALLRPEFAELRSYSLRRRAQPQLRELLITMGGVDKDNATGKVLDVLRTSLLPVDCRITVVLGPTAPWLAEVELHAQSMPWPTRVLVGVSDMARLMADSDLAIGAAGSTSWERCCLGLPSIVLVLAENQRFISSQLDRAGAAEAVDPSADGFEAKLQRLIANYCMPGQLAQKSAKAATVCDGLGAQRVGNALYDR